MKRIIAIILTALIFACCVFSVTGLGSLKPVQDKLKLGLDFQGGVYVVMEAQTSKTGAELRDLMEQTQSVIENRVNQMGLSEPVVTIEGENRIRVELPGAEDAEEAISTIGKTAQLYFVLGDGTTVLDGSMVKDADYATDEQGFPAVSLEFDSEGTERFAAATEAALSGAVKNATTGAVDRCIYIILDGECISFPQVNQVIPNGKAIIQGRFTADGAVELARLIRAGALPVDLKEVETSVIGPSLGLGALDSSIKAGAIGIGIVLLLMLIGYFGMGIVSDVALLLYIALTFWVLALFHAVLNLPGIAGIILGIGMAVDANVIIFARVREEYAENDDIQTSVQTGFKNAFTTILDSQITTLIAGVVLYQFGTGSVKGFALTLMISIFISVFTAVVISQFLLKALVSGKISPKFLGLESKLGMVRPQVHIIKNRKWLYLFSAVIIVAGIGVGFLRGFNYGIDFTGGTRMHMDLHTVAAVSDVEDILKENGLSGTVVHSGEGNQEIIIKTTTALDNETRQAVLDDFEEAYGITESDVLEVEHFSASVGTMLKKNAVKAMALAALCMLIYIAIRFKWQFAVGAIVALAHDVLMVIAFYGLFNIPINNPFIAGILTVVGYSINDTIVVFDRIRENRKIERQSKKRKHPHWDELIDTSISQTMMRSLMTSLTTVAAIIPLLLMGGKTIGEFCIPLLIGVLAGTLSSITIASPVFYELASRAKEPIDKDDDKPKYKTNDNPYDPMNGAVV